MAEKTQLQLLWNDIKEYLAIHLNPYSYEAQLKTLVPVDIINSFLVLKSDSEHNAYAVERHADSLNAGIKKYGETLGLKGYCLVVEGSSTFTTESAYQADPFQPSPINKKSTFDNFVAGPANKFVYAAAKAVAEAPGETFNPLFIYGESGLGKTHLLHAIANYIEETQPTKKVLYTTCENFLNEFVNSLAHKNNEKFRAHYRSVDVLMIDDIQFLTNKTQVQEEFFHTFNKLSQENKQIVLTSDSHPDKIATLADRLRTRFKGGMIVDVQPPDLETKIAILKRKALDRKCIMPDDVLAFLAENTNQDVRTLEGRLTKVIFASKLHEEPITLSLARRALQESVSDETEEKEEITQETVLSAVCSYYKVKREDIVGKSRNADLVKARQICAYLIYEMLSPPYASIGKLLGGRDHTTMMHSCQKVEKLLGLNDRYAKEVDDIKNIVLKQ
ncbi:MAG: chromosomal replication initiator protein DnaA [Clostridia bacterium]|nr:chromosomal replication initiator protein DnaA [Clostridia bacterium]